MMLIPEELEALLARDAELVAELTALGESGADGGAALVVFAKQRVDYLESRVTNAKRDAAQKAYWAGLSKFDQAAAAERLKNPILLRPNGTPDISGKDTGAAFAGRGEPGGLGRGAY